MNSLPDGFLVAWYGDDFTGAAAVMEVLTFSGIPAMLFLDVPTQAQLAQYPDLRAVGVASTARASSPDEMTESLAPAFAALLALDPALLHYKVCSTLDSSPDIGSIGRAIEIGADLTEPQMVPVLIAAPQMQRFQVFGHLFAGHGDQVYRLDRHPVMARHPVTPMSEADVARHIAAQSDKIDAELWAGKRLPSRPDAVQVVTLDSQDAASETSAGRMIWEGRDANRFVVGSQGVEYALVRHWTETGALKQVDPPKGAGRADGMVVVSGSVSPTTAEQISWSRANGFETVRFDATQAVGDANALSAEIDRIVQDALAAIEAGRDPLIFTAEGPDDPAVASLHDAVKNSGADMAKVNRKIGQALGEILDRILTKSGIRRAVISGGDTSGYATRQLGIFALSALAPTIPGASLCMAHADGPMAGLELALKGGQMGSPDYFGWIRDGGGQR